VKSDFEEQLTCKSPIDNKQNKFSLEQTGVVNAKGRSNKYYTQYKIEKGYEIYGFQIKNLTLGNNNSFISATLEGRIDDVAKNIQNKGVKLNRYEGKDAKGKDYIFYIGNVSEAHEINLNQNSNDTDIGCVEPDTD
jgi:hypothetical protein